MHAPLRGAKLSMKNLGGLKKSSENLRGLKVLDVAEFKGCDFSSGYSLNALEVLKNSNGRA